MKELAAELAKLRDVVTALPKRRVLPTTHIRPTRRVLERVLNALDVTPALPEARLDQIKREIISAQRNGTKLSTLPRRTLRDSCALLWPNASDGIDRPSLRQAVAAHTGTSRSMLRRLIDAWLSHFSGVDKSFTDISHLIVRRLADDHGGILGVWKRGHQLYNLFDATRGPSNLAGRLLDCDGDVLAECRLDTASRATSGYLRSVHFALSRSLPVALRAEKSTDVLRRASGFYVLENRLRFDEKEPNGIMADGLVAPWTVMKGQPSEHVRSEVLAYLRQHLGDPRVDGRQRWTGASEETRRTVRGWLSKLSLDAFFNLVGRFAANAGMDHQWKAREAFWSDCLRKNHIVDSWLVLGYNVARAIGDNRDLQGSYGGLADGDANHSVLLMKIGSTIFAEWSHNGKLRAWSSDWKNAPQLFGGRYTRSQLIATGIQFPPPDNRRDLTHTNSDGLTHHHGIWQGRVAALLLKKEGIELRPRDGGW